MGLSDLHEEKLPFRPWAVTGIVDCPTKGGRIIQFCEEKKTIFEETLKKEFTCRS
jgi:hypothetical protein